MAGPMYLNGQLLTSAGRAYPTNYQIGPAGNILQTAAGNTIVQLHWTSPDLPVSRRPIPSSLEFVVSDESIYNQLLSASCSAIPSRLFLGTWVSDTWLLSAAASTQTAWRTSRRLPYALPLIGRTGDTHWGPKAWVGGVEQTVLSSGTPSSGQVVIPSSGDYYGTVTTPAASTLGGDLVVSYPAEFFARISVSHSFSTANALAISLSAEEILP